MLALFWSGRADRVTGEHSLQNLLGAKITALGTYVPPKILSNQDLEKMVDTTDQWIIDRTGIRQRHIVEKGVGSSDLAVQGACRALAQRGIRPAGFEALLVAPATPHMMIPVN